MEFQVSLTQAHLGHSNLFRRRVEVCGRNFPVGKQAIEFRFLFDQSLAHGHSFRLHGLEEAFRMFSLLGTQTKSVRILQDVRRAWIAVQLGRESKAHSASSPQISDLLLRQGLHCALLQASVRMMSLTESDTRYCGHDKDEENFRHSGPPKRCLSSLALFQAQHHRAPPKGTTPSNTAQRAC